MPSADSGLLVLADDLSGAAEAAATLGSPVRVLLTGSNSSLSSHGFHDLAAESPMDIAVDLDCRYLCPADAVSRTNAALDVLRARERFTYIKIDSLLRGNITAHLSAAIDHSSGPVIFAPTLPQQNRTVVGGVPFMDGVRLDETRAWSVEDGSAPASLSDLCPEQPAHLELGQLRASEPQELTAWFRSARLITADAESMEDLEQIVALAKSTGAVIVGSAALARAFADTRSDHLAPTAGSGTSQPDSDISQRDSRSSSAPSDASDLPILFALGTAADRIDDQLAHLRSHATVDVVDIPASELAAWADNAGVLAATADRVRAGLGRGHLVVRLTDSGESVDPRPLPGLLADLIAHSLTNFGPVHLAATGGETARALLDRLGIHALDAIREIHPGAVLSQVGATSASSGERTELSRVVTRPGGQGDESSLAHIYDALTQTSTQSASSPRALSRTTKENE
ncbi:4-hydroxythreonine-4-phosphate dehydrogenase [Brevibacterium sandarakinum]|uniref:4-hydroxythreonine-4-phosphate dehydrogenase n=1 Tax=Brevibacterium sandarakinum TaxID=629680 RepID=A0A1H1QLM1_BRESA|nr:four-carbon acid sugar kinase family protein [Brevibacterium sandarakinum]SDS24391.1 4-hydroxythreonine-4-phosphate dehydrogenase [Brevibacterium sandarakinum]